MAHVSDHSHMLLAHRTAHRIHKTLAGVLCRDTSASRGAYERSYHQRVSSAVSGQSRAEDLEAHPNSIALQVSGCAPCSSRSIMEPAHSGHPPHLYSRVLPLSSTSKLATCAQASSVLKSTALALAHQSSRIAFSVVSLTPGGGATAEHCVRGVWTKCKSVTSPCIQIVCSLDGRHPPVPAKIWRSLADLSLTIWTLLGPSTGQVVFRNKVTPRLHTSSLNETGSSGFAFRASTDMSLVAPGED